LAVKIREYLHHKEILGQSNNHLNKHLTLFQMKRKPIFIILFFVTTLVVSGFIPQVPTQDTLDSVTLAIQKGSSSELGTYFNPTVELKILEEDNIYSKAQAVLLLKDFFSRNVPTSFKINHQGTKGTTSFAIGNLMASTGSFRVSIFMKTENDKMLIHQFRVERSE
jgi:hypothetical protein